MRNPCKDCRERRAGAKDGPSCHAGCEKYAAWRAEVDARKAEEKLGKEIDAMVAAVARKRQAYLAAEKRRRKQR